MLTLGTQRELTNDMLIKGIIDSVVTVNQFYGMLPFKGIQGNALAYNREKATLDQRDLVGTLDTANTAQLPAGGAFAGINKAQQTFDRYSTELTTIIGDAQVNGLIQAVGSDYNDATAVQVAAKAKGLGRTYMNALINGARNGLGTQVSTSTAISAAAFVLTGESATAIGNEITNMVATGNGTTSTITAATVIITGTTNNLVVAYKGYEFVGPFVSAATGGDLTTSGAALLNLVRRVESISQNVNSGGQETNGWSAFDGLENFVLTSNNFINAAGSAAVNGSRLAYLDEIIDRVHDKDGMVDYLMMNSAGVRKITADFRSVGTGFDMMDVKTSSGSVMAIQSYRGVPIFRNDFIGNSFVDSARSALLGGDGSDDSTIYAGTIDDGSFSHGICGLTALKSAGMQVQKLGAREEADADITRVKWYCGLAHFSELGLVRGSMG